jgi:hypothetical protein
MNSVRQYIPDMLSNKINALTKAYLNIWGTRALSDFSKAQYLKMVKLVMAPSALAIPAETT